MNFSTELPVGRKIVFLALLVFVPLSLSAKKVVVKLATLAPQESTWHELLMEMGQAWHDSTNGDVVLRIYPSGVAGDERHVIRKIRINQLHAAAVTIEGLTDISRNMNVFYIPLLVQSFQDLDYIRSQLWPDLTEELESRGFKVLTWADVGWAYWFTKEPILTPQELKGLRLFTWAGDYRWAELWKKAGFQPVPLAMVDVLPSLQTGLIDAFSTTPLAALSFQWFAAAPHMLNLKWGPVIGAIIISTRTWESIPSAYHPVLLKIAGETENRARELVSEEERALDVMGEHGLEIHHLTREQLDGWVELTQSFYPDLRGSLVPAEIFDKAIQLKRELDAQKENDTQSPNPIE